MKHLTHPSKTITQNGYSVTVSEANVLQGVRRSFYRMDSEALITGEDDDALKYIKRMLYPDTIAAVREQSGFDHWPLTLDEFLTLPEAFVIEIEDAVYSLNPHWKPKPKEESPEKAQEKKDSTKTS
jgi:hypothetical protein